MNEHIRFVYHKKDRESARKKYIKYHGKVKGLKEYEASMWNDKITTYNVIFTSKLSIKKMLKRQTEKIFLIGVEYLFGVCSENCKKNGGGGRGDHRG